MYPVESQGIHLLVGKISMSCKVAVRIQSGRSWGSGPRSERQWGCGKEEWLIRQLSGNSPVNSSMGSWVGAHSLAKKELWRGHELLTITPWTADLNAIPEANVIHSWQSAPPLWSWGTLAVTRGWGLARQHRSQGRKPQSILQEPFQAAGLLSVLAEPDRRGGSY